MGKGQIKRAIIISIYATIFVLLLFAIYSRLKPKPNCFDGKLNQNEQGIDCGGICATRCALVAENEIMVAKTGFVESGVAGSFDVYGVVKNSNQTLGSGNFEYQFTMKNAAGELLGQYADVGFILPGEEKYVLKDNIAMKDIPAKVELMIGKTNWIEENEFYEKPQLKVEYKKYNEISSGVGFFEATGLLKNESPLDFAKIKIKIILKDERGEIVALNSTEMSTVTAGENRDFRVFWPNRFAGTVANMEAQPETNIFSSEAFVKKYFKPQQFQQGAN